MEGKCLSARYNRRDRILSPYGIVIREPKFYLLANEVSKDSNDDSDQLRPPRQFLCNRFEHLAISVSGSELASIDF